MGLPVGAVEVLLVVHGRGRVGRRGSLHIRGNGRTHVLIRPHGRRALKGGRGKPLLWHEQSIAGVMEHPVWEGEAEGGTPSLQEQARLAVCGVL